MSTLLNEMDGIDQAASGHHQIFVFAATNRIDAIDAALLRKGRFHHLLHVPPPSESDAVKLISYFGDKYQLSAEATVRVREKYRSGQSGADIEGLCKDEKMLWLRSDLAKATITV